MTTSTPYLQPIAITSNADQLAGDIWDRAESRSRAVNAIATALRQVERGRLIVTDAWSAPDLADPHRSAPRDAGLVAVIHDAIVGLSDQQARQVAVAVMRWMRTPDAREIAALLEGATDARIEWLAGIAPEHAEPSSNGQHAATYQPKAPRPC